MADIPMSAPDITHRERQAVLDVLDTNILSIGPQVLRFEQTVARYIDIPFAVAVNSGTAGLHLAMIVAGVRKGDEVITPSFSFISSANCVVYQGARPVFVDVDRRTGNIDPSTIEAAISKRTKAILPVHAFGQPADMDSILDIASRHGLPVIEDACEAIGSCYKGRPAGTLGDAAVFAFYPNKQMTTGEGGMVVTRHKDWATLYQSLRNQGRDVFNAWLNHTRLGYNYRLNELSAALGMVQAERLDELIEKRSAVASWYHERLAGVDLVEVPCIDATTTRMSWFVYVVRIRRPAQRDTVMSALASKGIPSRAYFTPIHLQPVFQRALRHRSARLPVTEELGNVSLALPFSSVMTEDEVDRVAQALKECLLHEAART